MGDWRKKEFEISEKPSGGDSVQYVVIHILKAEKLGIDKDDIRFYMREEE